MHRRLAAVGITTREACGNTVRNVTACPHRGRLPHGGVRRHALRARADVLPARPRRHPGLRAQVQGRVLGLQGERLRPDELPRHRRHRAHARGRRQDRARLRAGASAAGSGAVPQAAQAVRRVPARGGAAADRAGDEPRVRAPGRAGEPRARAHQVRGQEAGHRGDQARWCSRSAPSCAPIRAGRRSSPTCTPSTRSRSRPPGRCRRRRIPTGFDGVARAPTSSRSASPATSMATITLPLGDLTSEQARALADIARKYTGDTMRTTADQNMLLRWVSEADLPDVYAALKAIGLAAPGAGTISDICACPGTDTCKLGISSSRALAARAGQAAARVGHRPGSEREAACTSRPAAASTRARSTTWPTSASWASAATSAGGACRTSSWSSAASGRTTAARYGLAIGAVPSKRVPEVVEAADRALRQGAPGRRDRSPTSPTASARRRSARWSRTCRCCRPTTQDPSYYSDWGDPREYTIADMGEGECAGEVVPYVEVELAAAERELFEAQVLLDEKQDRRRRRGARSRRCCRRRAR